MYLNLQWQMKRWHCGGHILSAKPSVPLWIVWEGKSWMQERAYSRAEAHALSESLSGKVWLFLLQTNWLSRHFFPLWNDSGLMKADQSVGRKRGSGIRKTGMELMGFFLFGWLGFVGFFWWCQHYLSSYFSPWVGFAPFLLSHSVISLLCSKVMQ